MKGASLRVAEASAADVLEAALARHFGFEAFRPGQRRIVEALLDGRDVLAVMPTGAGKSLCFQLPALLLDGVTVVISPLIALMKDQVDALVERGIPAAAIHSGLNPEAQRRVLDGLSAGTVRLLYVAPERFRQARFLEALGEAGVGLFAVDEAHCISQWGHDFRPEYARLGEVRARLAPPRTVALTATATRRVRSDILEGLGLTEAEVVVHGFDRPNLSLAAEHCPGRAAKLTRLLAAMAHAKSEEEPGSAIVYCSTRRGVEQVAQALRQRGHRALAYHAGLDSGRRKAVQDRWTAEPGWTVVATNAFGMGVDKAEVRLVVHHDLPRTLEAYYQEAGRAGRDGRPARALLLWSDADAVLHRRLIAAGAPEPEVVARVWNRLVSRGGTRLSGPLSALAERAGVDVLEADAALRLLAGARHLLTEPMPEAGHVRVRLVTPEVPASDLAIDFERLARHRALEEARLEEMLAYAQSATCRRRTLLTYFGDPDAPADGARCRRIDPDGTAHPGCDVCEDEAALATGQRGLDRPAATRRVRAVLELLAAFDGRYGRQKIVLSLLGSRAKVLHGTGLSDHPSHGALRRLGEARVRALLARLQGAGLVERLGAPYAVLGLTPRGRAVLEGTAPVPPAVLLAAAPPPSISRTGAAEAEDPGTAERLAALRALRARASRARRPGLSRLPRPDPPGDRPGAPPDRAAASRHRGGGAGEARPLRSRGARPAAGRLMGPGPSVRASGARPAPRARARPGARLPSRRGRGPWPLRGPPPWPPAPGST